MAYPPLVNRFTFDPPPSGMDPIVAEWAEAQFRRLQNDLIALIQDSEMALPELPRWDDFRAPATIAPVSGATGEPDRAEDGALLFANNLVEQIPFLFQLPHNWPAWTPVRPHVHWKKAADGAGGVMWELRYRVWNLHDLTPAWSAWLQPAGRSMTLGTTQETLIDYWNEIDLTGIDRSAMLSIQLRRNINAASDTYADDAKLWELDLHRQQRGDGTYNEYGPW